MTDRRHPISAVIGLPPVETVRAFEARDELRATVRWSEMWHEDHARAFTVAKLARMDILAELQASLADMLANGGTFEQWQAGIVPYLERQGWWGEVRDRALTGTDDLVSVGPRRLRTIYDTNLRVSRAAGRWARIQELKRERPFLRYTAVMDARTRPEHAAWHGTILPVDHPWWDTHFPPCGWYCRCTVRQLSQRELDAKGWQVTETPPAGPPRHFRRANGAEVEVPQGISPGFAYNPGKASMAAIADKASRSIEALALRDLAAARAAVAELATSDALPAFLAGPQGAFPIAVLDADQMALLDAPSPVLVLPAAIKRKQERNHPELRDSDYQRLPAAIHDPLVMIEAAEGEKLIFYADAAGRLWKAVARTDANPEWRSAIVSFHMTDAKNLARDARRGRVMLDRRK